jgi:biotin carboxyl carrier protein
MPQIIINDKHNYQVEQQGNNFIINDKTVSPDFLKINEKQFHILQDNKAYVVEIIRFDQEEKVLHLKINKKACSIKILNKLDQLLEKMGLNKKVATSVKDIKAPMPGLIVDIKVSEGQEVKKGDPLIILEAMKMENIIKAPGEGVVKKIKVNKGESVEKNQILILF